MNFKTLDHAQFQSYRRHKNVRSMDTHTVLALVDVFGVFTP